MEHDLIRNSQTDKTCFNDIDGLLTKYVDIVVLVINRSVDTFLTRKHNPFCLRFETRDLRRKQIRSLDNQYILVKHTVGFYAYVNVHIHPVPFAYQPLPGRDFSHMSTR